MIINNTIKFGYGDVLVGSTNLLGEITFTYIKPPLEVGTGITEEIEKTIEVISEVRFGEDKPFEFYNLVKTVNKDNPIIAYKGYIFDFTNYNEESVNVVKRHAKNMVNLFALAC